MYRWEEKQMELESKIRKGEYYNLRVICCAELLLERDLPRAFRARLQSSESWKTAQK